jgi:ABC-type spermidine/putrescine transport system permease subunit II
VTKRLVILIAGTLLAWGAAAYPARLLGGDAGLIYSAVAAALCLLPTALTLLWAEWVSRQSPEQQLTMVLGGTGIRMGVVMGIGLLLYLFLPYFEQPGFWLWLLAFYLFTLALEMVLVVRGRTAVEQQRGPASARPGS